MTMNRAVLTFELSKGRLSFRLTAPYSEKGKIGETGMQKNGIRSERKMIPLGTRAAPAPLRVSPPQKRTPVCSVYAVSLA